MGEEHDKTPESRTIPEDPPSPNKVEFVFIEGYPPLVNAHKLREGKRVDIRDMYHRVYRKPREGTIAAAVTSHWQACGFVAWVFDLHPNRVAEIVAETRESAPEAMKEGR